MLKLQKQLLNNVLNACGSTDKACTVTFSRADRAEITLMKNLFEIEASLENFNAKTNSDKWTEMINSSQMEFSYKAQAQYLMAYVPEILPDNKKNKKINQIS